MTFGKVENGCLCNVEALRISTRHAQQKGMIKNGGMVEIERSAMDDLDRCKCYSRQPIRYEQYIFVRKGRQRTRSPDEFFELDTLFDRAFLLPISLDDILQACIGL